MNESFGLKKDMFMDQLHIIGRLGMVMSLNHLFLHFKFPKFSILETSITCFFSSFFLPKV